MASESSVLVRLRLLGGSAFAREAQGAGRGLGALGSQGTRTKRGLDAVNKGLTVGAAALRGVGLAAGVAAAGGLAFGVKKGVAFEQSMANVQARLLTSKANMGLLSQQALDLGAKTQFSAQQAADAMNEFAAAGFDTRQIMGLMPGTLNLAAASGEDLATTAELQGAMMRQFGLHASDAGHVADVLTTAVNKSAIGMDDLGLTMKYVGPVAGRFGQSIEDIGGAAAILGNVGIKGETAGTTLRRAFVNLIRPSKRTSDVLNSMGITTREMSKATVNAKGDLRSFPAILGNLAGQFKDLTKPQQRRALAQLFGVEALPGMLTLFGKGEAGIRKMSGQLRNSGGAAERTAGIMRDTVAGAWDNFTGSVETAAIQLTKRFNPALKDGLNWAAKLADKLPGTVTGFVAGAVGGRAAPGPRATAQGQAGDRGAPKELTGAAKVGAQLRATLQPTIAWVQTEMPKVGLALLGAGRDLIAAFAPAAPFFSNVLLPLLKGLAVGVLGGVVFAFKLAVPIIKVVATALGMVGRFLAPLRPLFFGVGVVIGAIAGGPILGLLGRLRYLGVVFRIMRVPIQVASGAFRGLLAVVGRVFGAFGRALQGVQRFIGTFQGLPARAARAALNLVGGVVRAVESLPGKLMKIVGRVGRTIIDGIVAGIKAAPGVIFEAIKSLLPGGKVGGKILSALGLQTGGTVRRGGWAVVGERGPELARLPGGSTVYDSSQTRRARAAMAPAPALRATAVLQLDRKTIHTAVFEFDRQQQEAT